MGEQWASAQLPSWGLAQPQLVLSGRNPGSPDTLPGPVLHCSLDRGTKMTDGDSTGDPSIHGSSWTMEKGVRAELAPGSRQHQCPPWPCPGC